MMLRKNLKIELLPLNFPFKVGKFVEKPGVKT